MNVKVLYQVPKEIGDPEMDLLREEILRFQYIRDGDERRAGLRFNEVAAIQLRVHRRLLGAAAEQDGWQSFP